MAVKVLVNDTKLDTMIEKCQTAIDNAGSIITKFSNLTDMKISTSSELVKKTHTDPDTNEEVVDYDYTSNADSYNSGLENLSKNDDGPCGCISKFKEGMTNYINALKQIRTAIQNFDSTKPSLKSALASVEGYDSSNWKFETVDGVEVAKYRFVDANGNVTYITVAEMVNSAYTAINMEMSQAVLAGLRGEKPDMDTIITDVNSFVTSGLKSRAFAVASKDDMDKVLTDSGHTWSEYDSILKDIYGANAGLETQVNAVVSAGFLASGLVLAGLGAADPDKAGKKKKSPGGNNSGGNNHGGNNPGGNNPGGNNPGDTTNTPVETDPVDTDPEEPVGTTPHNDIEITTPIDDKEIPSELDLDLTDNEEEVNYDELARKEYENTDLEDINEYREDLINSINEKFDAGDLDSIKEKLAEYGYSEDDIAKIIEDRQSTITAILAGDEKQQLVEIAERLYKEAHPDAVLDENGLLKDFTSIYKQEPKYEDLVNGTENQLLINIEQNEDLAEYRDSVNNAHEDYKNEAEAANTAIAQAATAQTTMENLKSEYTAKYGTDDTKKWDEEAAKKYNESIESYNDSVNKAKDANAKAMDAKAKYEDAVDKYDNAKKELLDQVKEDNDRTDFWGDLKDDDSSGDTPGDTGGDTPGGTDEEVLNNFPDGDSTGDTPGDTGGDTTGGTDDETDLGDGEFDPNDPNSLLDAFGGDVKSEQVDSMTETLADSQTDSITETLTDSQTDSVTETLANSQTDSITESLSDESSEVGDSISDSNLNKNSDVSSTSVSSGSSSDTLLKADGAGESVDSSVSNTLLGNVGGNTGGSSSDGFVDNKPVDMKTSESSSSDTDETDERSEDTSKGIDGVEVISSGSDSIGDKIDSEIGTESNVPVDSNDEIENIEEMELPELNDSLENKNLEEDLNTKDNTSDEEFGSSDERTEQIENLNQIDKIDEIEDTGKIDESLGLESIEESSEQEGISIPEETDASENIDGVGISSDEEMELPDLNAGSLDEISETDANI